MPEYTLTDLAKLAGLKPRTVRFYIQQGLLPSPEFAGAATRYSDEHLDRLLAIKRLRSADQPLPEIKKLLGDLAARPATTDAPPAGPSTAALDYVRALLSPAQRPAQDPAQSPAPLGELSLATAAFALPSPAPAQATRRSQWERISLTPDIEIHVRRPQDRTQARAHTKRVERLVTLAQQLLEEED